MLSRIIVVILEAVIVAVLFADGLLVEKRSAASDRTAEEYPDYQLGVKYDEYPMVVPKKKTALLVDRLMMALQQAIEEDEMRTSNRIDTPAAYNLSPEEVRKMDLQRRGHGGLGNQNNKGRIYWRCYFNAVACF